MVTQINQDTVNKALWSACDVFRGTVSADTYKDYILTMLFLKYISDVWQDHYDNYKNEYGDEPELIEEMIEQLLRDKQIDRYKLREEMAILMSCKRSIKANHYLTKEDMTHLLDELSGCTDPFTCPHGRPVIIHFSSYEMEKMFKRIM